MKQKAILTSLTTLALMAGSAAASASQGTFTTGGAMVTESTNYNGAILYTPGLWNLGGVISATLTINLQDDNSTSATALIDSPREWAKLTTPLTDGTHTLATDSTSIEVGVHPITAAGIIAGMDAQGALPTNTTQLGVITAAAPGWATSISNLGFENLLGKTPAAETANYWTLDVTSLLNASNSGTLGFGLGVDAKYADIPYYLPGTTTVNPDWTLVNQVLAGSLPPGADIAQFEDYRFNSATLNVTYAPVPVPAAVWLFGSALAGLIGFRRKSV
jgi:hypothetical protein